MKSGLKPRSIAMCSEAQHALMGFGRRITASPLRKTSTSSTSKRKSLGSWTACELPGSKT